MTVTNKIAVLFFTVVYMFSATATKELLKLPVLVEHFYDHQDENKNIRLPAFLVMHYFLEDGTDKDAAEDKQLPFKSADQMATCTFNSLTPPSFIQLPAGYSTGLENQFCTHIQLSPAAEHLPGIWQPPRYCLSIA